MITASHDGFQFHVPVNTAPAPGPVPIRVTRFYTDGGDFVVNMQDDMGNVRAVKYRITPTEEFPDIVTADETTWEAVGVAEL